MPSAKRVRDLFCAGVLSILAMPGVSWGQSGKLDSAAPDASIGAITRLARQIKIEELNRQLREARGLNGNMPVAAFPPIGPSTQQSPSTPAVTSISGVGVALTATLNDGRRIKTGETFQGSGHRWIVDSITPSAVTFRRCEEGQKCASAIAVLVSVGG